MKRRTSEPTTVEDVSVLGTAVARDLFGETDPIGQRVSICSTKFTVIGVMSEKGVVQLITMLPND